MLQIIFLLSGVEFEIQIIRRNLVYWYELGIRTSGQMSESWVCVKLHIFLEAHLLVDIESAFVLIGSYRS